MEKFFHSDSLHLFFALTESTVFLLQRNVQFFFSIEGSNVVSFLVEFSDDFACIWSVNCFFFFQHNHSGKQIELVSKRNTCCHWSLVVIGHKEKKSNLGMRRKVFFFPSIHSSSRVFFVCLAGSIYFVFFLFILFFFFFAFFCQMSNLCEKKKKRNTHSNLESCFRLKKKFPKRNVVNDVIGWFSSFATMCYI